MNGRSHAARLTKAYRINGDGLYIKKTIERVLLISKDKLLWDIWEKNLLKYDESSIDERNQP